MVISQLFWVLGYIPIVPTGAIKVIVIGWILVPQNEVSIARQAKLECRVRKSRIKL